MRAVIHGGFRGLKTADARQAWGEFFNAMGVNQPERVFILPWALPEKSHPKTLNAFRSRAAAHWQFSFRCEILPTPEALHSLCQRTPFKDTKPLFYIPGGILVEKCVAAMAGFDKEMLPTHAEFAGFSAGAYALMNFYYAPRKKRVLPGGGLFEGAVCCHGDGERQACFEGLIQQKHHPIYFLPDGAFKVITA